jgi:hypothetical protein
MSRSNLAIDALCGPTASDRLQPAAVFGCPLSGTLAFAYRVDPLASAPGVLTLFGIDEAGDVSYYVPTPVDDRPIEIEIGRWHPLAMSIDLEVNHTPGVLRLHAVITPVPLDVQDVDEAVEILRSRPPAPQAPWTSRLGGQGRIAALCALPETCPCAELAFRIHEDVP